jgi:AhpD family alkylhydroperoxidase
VRQAGSGFAQRCAQAQYGSATGESERSLEPNKHMNPRLNYAKNAPELTRKLYELSGLVKKTSLGNTLVDLIDIRASQLNGCAFCVDMHSKEAKIHGDRELRIYHLPVWRESPLFSDAEKAALEWTEALTKLGRDGVSDEIYERARVHFSESQLAELSFAIGAINFWNRLGVGFRSVPGSADEMLGLTKSGLK